MIKIKGSKYLTEKNDVTPPKPSQRPGWAFAFDEQKGDEQKGDRFIFEEELKRRQ